MLLVYTTTITVEGWLTYPTAQISNLGPWPSRVKISGGE